MESFAKPLDVNIDDVPTTGPQLMFSGGQNLLLLAVTKLYLVVVLVMILVVP